MNKVDDTGKERSQINMDRKPRILVVDDDPDIVKEVSRVLKSKAYEVIVAYNGEEGLQKARKEKPDLLLLDVMMPVMDGFNVAEHFKRDSSLSQIPILALTSFSESLGQPFQFEVAEYLKKPIRAKDLLDALEKHLKRIGF